VVAAKSEEDAISVAFSENIPVDSVDDFDREVVRVVAMKERVYVS